MLSWMNPNRRRRRRRARGSRKKDEDQEDEEPELDPENDDYELADPDEYSSEAVDANAMGKGKGRGRGQGQLGAGNKGGRRGRKPSSRGRNPNRSSQKPNGPRKPPGLSANARLFRVAPHPFDDLDPNNLPEPRSNLGRSVIKASNQLRLTHIGRRYRENMGYSRDSSPSSVESRLPSDVDFDDVPEQNMHFGPQNRRIIDTAMSMKFCWRHPNPDEELARRMIEQRQEVTDAPDNEVDATDAEMERSGRDNEVDATVGDQRTPSVSSPQDAEIEGSGHGNGVDATVGGQRTPSVSPPQDADTEEPEAIEAAKLKRYHYHRRDGKIRRLRPAQFGQLEHRITSYRFMMQLDPWSNHRLR
eukprot:3526897-Amphidinium_carterae.1